MASSLTFTVTNYVTVSDTVHHRVYKSFFHSKCVLFNPWTLRLDSTDIMLRRLHLHMITNVFSASSPGQRQDETIQELLRFFV